MMVKHSSVVGVLPTSRWRSVRRVVAAVRAWQPNGVAGVSGDLTPRCVLRQLAGNPLSVQCQIDTTS